MLYDFSFFKAFKWGKQETLECVPLTISYHLHFPRISKVWSMFHHGSLGQVLSKEYYFVFTYNFLTFFLFCFSSKVFFLIFISFLDKVSNFRNRILTNQKPELVIWNYHPQCMIISIYHGLTLSYKENFLNFEPIQINNSRRGASKVRGLEENR